MAYNVLEVYKSEIASDGTQRIRADISCSTVADLPDDDSLMVDTACYVRQAGVWFVKDTDGWYNADGSGQPADDSVQSLSLSPNLGNSIRPAVDLDTLPVSEPEEVIEPAEDGEER